MRPFAPKTVQLPEELGMYVDELRKAYPTIGEVWLLDAQAGGGDSRIERKLLVFADRAALQWIRADRAVRRNDIALWIITDGDRFETPWGPPESGRLSSIRWRVEDLHSATCIGPDGLEATAVRVR